MIGNIHINIIFNVMGSKITSYTGKYSEALLILLIRNFCGVTMNCPNFFSVYIRLFVRFFQQVRLVLKYIRIEDDYVTAKDVTSQHWKYRLLEPWAREPRNIMLETNSWFQTSEATRRIVFLFYLIRAGILAYKWSITSIVFFVLAWRFTTV